MVIWDPSQSGVLWFQGSGSILYVEFISISKIEDFLGHKQVAICKKVFSLGLQWFAIARLQLPFCWRLRRFWAPSHATWDHRPPFEGFVGLLYSARCGSCGSWWVHWIDGFLWCFFRTSINLDNSSGRAFTALEALRDSSLWAIHWGDRRCAMSSKQETRGQKAV